MRYECPRCDAVLHHNDPPHLCKDVAGRLTAHRHERRAHLLKLIRGVRCMIHGIKYQIVCGVRACGLCYIAEPFRAAKPLPAWDGVLIHKFNGHGQKVAHDPLFPGPHTGASCACL